MLKNYRGVRKDQELRSNDVNFEVIATKSRIISRYHLLPRMYRCIVTGSEALELNCMLTLPSLPQRSHLTPIPFIRVEVSVFNRDTNACIWLSEIFDLKLYHYPI